MYNEEMVREFVASLRKVNLRNPFTASSIFENIVNAPNVNAVVDSEGNVDTLVLSDQILQGNRYLGNTYPSRVSDKIEDEIDRVTQVIGSYLHKKGYIGMFGLDFLINNMGDLVVIDLNPRHQGGYACNGLLFNAGRASLTDIELDILTGEKLNCNLEKIQSIDYAWAHSKLKPADKGEKIMSELQLNTITSPFLEVGASFVGEFYKKGSVFIEGYIGYQVSTGEDVENTLEALSLSKKTFDNQVLGDI